MGVWLNVLGLLGLDDAVQHIKVLREFAAPSGVRGAEIDLRVTLCRAVECPVGRQLVSQAIDCQDGPADQACLARSTGIGCLLQVLGEVGKLGNEVVGQYRSPLWRST